MLQRLITSLDELDSDGTWSRDQLERMDAAFIGAVLRAFSSGHESPVAASSTVRLNGSRRLAEEAAIGAAWRWFVDAKFDVPAAVILARCPGVAPERVREGIKRRFASWSGRR